jgi:hypothetical protein
LCVPLSSSHQFILIDVSSAQEIAALRKEAVEFDKVRSILRSQNAERGEAPKMAFQKVFPILN